jgi:hypothetical protein
MAGENSTGPAVLRPGQKPGGKSDGRFMFGKISLSERSFKLGNQLYKPAQFGSFIP